MASLRSLCSYARRAPRERRLIRPELHAIAIFVLVSACGHAGEGAATVPGANPGATGAPGAAADVGSNAASGAAGQMPSAQTALCVPADEGRLRARLSGEIDAEIDWSVPTPQCLGGQRPDGEGVRLIYKGDIPGEGPLLVVIGIGPLARGRQRGHGSRQPDPGARGCRPLLCHSG